MVVEIWQERRPRALQARMNIAINAHGWRSRSKAEVSRDAARLATAIRLRDVPGNISQRVRFHPLFLKPRPWRQAPGSSRIDKHGAIWHIVYQEMEARHAVPRLLAPGGKFDAEYARWGRRRL